MCNVCGCDDTAHALTHAHPHDANDHDHRHDTALPDRGVQRITIDKSILAVTEDQAARNRARFNEAGVLVVNLMSSPGAGKTTLLERTVAAIDASLSIAVIEGDLATENDAKRMRACGIQAEQITTGIACHLDAEMIDKVLQRFDLSTLDILFIENVGNLICPACFDLGQHHNVALLSVPEGDDKPEKYPVMFRAIDLMLVTKIDYLPVAPTFNVERAIQSLRTVGSDAPVIPLSGNDEAGLADWLLWLYCNRDLASSPNSMSVSATAL